MKFEPDRRSILVVDDSADIRMLINLFLSNEGYKVELAEDGMQALQKLRSADELPGVIFLDLMMPVMDGFEFRTEQENDPRLSDIPVLVMTADANIEEKTMKLHAKGFLRKPVGIQTLLAAAKKYCH